MTGNLFKLCLVIFLTSLIILPVSLIHTVTALSSREENLKMANEFYLTGKRLMKEGNYQAANEAFKKAQSLLEEKSYLTPEDSGLQTYPKLSHKTKSRAGLKNEETKEAYLEDIKASIKKADIYYNKAIEFIKDQQYRQAADSLEEVVILNPRDKDAYYNLGVLNEIYLNDKNKALMYYQKFIKLAPNSEDAKEVKRWIEEISK